MHFDIGVQFGISLHIDVVFDFALVDVNLDGETSYPVADLLKSRGAPFAFSTGYGCDGLDRKYADVPLLTKPFLSADLQRVLSRALR